MATLSFDTHQFVKTLEKRGFTQDQAEGINEALKDALTVAEVATKHDLRELEYRLTLKLGTLIAAAIGIVATIVKLL
ncbi:hypothetical protein PG1C_05735 [Rugosibacter aromaticivorans]|uniref:DUF1640 domain-containing protein n=1 Tax=Rugosibacter aromaticivorans TaxID=1565605 RepID=A0A0C5J8R0_9PROT|nr:coiled-coil domain-containing protein [Rugosibacter aromaticivorans]AJP48098.1 hypothetical protein PG1C_05735 [Rugosibacter aromaticivorans]TBR14289.1 MAG: DUF1640 domain-containing protein [Rugosibacter sp.]